jgi:hypothetical protein
MAETFKRRNHGSGHSYRLGDRKVPGVTTILNAGIPKTGLIGWAGSTVAEYVVDRLTAKDGHVLADDLVAELRAGAKYPIPPGLPRVKLAKELSFAPNRERDAGANKGGKVHDLAHQLATGATVEVPPELTGYVDAYLDWYHAWHPVDELAERPVLNRDAFYAGTFDLWCRIPGWGRCLIDYKTGRSGIYGETALQVAAYRYAEVYIDETGTEIPMPEVDHCLGVWFRPDGSWETYPLSAGPAEYRLFRYAYELAKFLDGPKLFGLEGEDAPVQLARGEPIFPTTEATA